MRFSHTDDWCSNFGKLGAKMSIVVCDCIKYKRISSPSQLFEGSVRNRVPTTVWSLVLYYHGPHGSKERETQSQIKVSIAYVHMSLKRLCNYRIYAVLSHSRMQHDFTVDFDSSTNAKSAHVRIGEPLDQ